MNGQFHVENHRVADPATNADLCAGDAGAETESDRENVLHVTSNGDGTRDYSSGIVNVNERFERDLTLDEVTSSGDVAFNYFQGPDNENAAPDEVFLILRKKEGNPGTLNDAGLFAAYKTINDDTDPDSRDVPCDQDNKEWRGVDVSAQMTGSGRRDWADIPISEESVASGQMVIETAQSIRDQEERFGSVLDRYGDKAILEAVGYGKGNTGRETTIDVYYDNLVVRRGQENVEEFDFPAAYPMDVEFRPPQVNTAGGGTLNASLSLQQEEVGLDPNDVQANSVKLTSYTPVAPAVEEGVSARSVNVTGGGIRAQFRVNQLTDVLEEGEQQVLISGTFDNDAHDAFLAQGTLNVRDPGRAGLLSSYR